jgi:transposase-like protein
MKYSEAFKAKMVQKMLGGRSANSVAQEAGVNQPTLSKWLRDARTLQVVPKRKSEEEPRKRAERRPEDWTAEEKLAAVMQARGLAGTELGEFLRREGLHEEQLRQWQQSADAAALESLKGGRRPKASSADTKRIKELERELRRKEKALAETAALLVLRKKAEALWGDEDASTEPKNDDEFSN